MRTLSLLVVMAITVSARAQATDQYGYPPNPSDPPAPSQPPSPTQPPPPSNPPSTTYQPPSPTPSNPPSTTPPNTSTITPYDPSKYADPSYSTNYSQTPPPHKLFISPDMHSKWRNARNVYTAGGVISLLGTGLTISSVIVVAATGYPCDPEDPIHKLNPMSTCNAMSATYDPPKPTDAAPLLSYLGASTSAFGFILSASGLGWQHSILRDLGGDVPRGTFYGGTVLGVLGFLGVGVGYLLAFTDFVNPHDQGVAILATTVTSAGLSALSSLLYMIDAGRTKKAWLKLQSF
jgi:hypothetical protein